MTNDPTPRFLLILPPAQSDWIRAAHDREAAAGRKAAFMAALNEVNYRLKYEADEWGESRELLAVLNVRIRVGTVGPITVWYGVDEVNRFAYVKRFRLRGDPPEG